MKKLLKSFLSQNREERRAEVYRNLMRHEAKIGGKIFGPVPAGGRREFFSLDEYTWIWHEEWTDEQGQPHNKTTRYDFRPDGVIKSQNGQYEPLTREEARRLRDAIRLYDRKTDEELYSRIRASRSGK